MDALYNFLDHTEIWKSALSIIDHSFLDFASLEITWVEMMD